MSEVTVVANRPSNPNGLVFIFEDGSTAKLPTSPSKWEYSDNYRWAQIDREGRKAVTRRVGSGLRTLNFSILVASLDYRASIEPRIRDLTGYGARGEVLRIKNGSANYQGSCWWYIKSHDMKVVRLTPAGEASQVELTFSLEEYVESATNVIKPPPPPPPPPPIVVKPTPTPVVSPVYRYHTVVYGDWLSKLAIKYLGRCERWREIYDLNKALIGSNPHRLRTGLRLKIPPK